MKTSETVTILVSPNSYAETEKSWRILYVKGRTMGSYSAGYWFPKKCCNYKKTNVPKGDGILTIPRWLFDILPQKEVVTLWQEKTAVE